jgi:hypothetical protein
MEKAINKPSFITKLTGENAIEFERWVKYGEPNKLSKEALIRGNDLLKKYQELGYAVIKLDAK